MNIHLFSEVLFCVWVIALIVILFIVVKYYRRVHYRLNSLSETIYTWDIEDMGLIYHQVNTYIEDDNFDMVSQEILLNGSFDKWSNRVHSAYENKPPARIQPKMESLLNKPGENSHDVWEEFEWGDFLLSREESLLLHTIQSERLSTDCSLFKRQPSIESALVI
ncbi:TPA: DUF6012 family protein [Escherichia coli]